MVGCYVAIVLRRQWTPCSDQLSVGSQTEGCDGLAAASMKATQLHWQCVLAGEYCSTIEFSAPYCTRQQAAADNIYRLPHGLRTNEGHVCRHFHFEKLELKTKPAVFRHLQS